MAPKQLILNAFDMACIGHQSPGQWRKTGDRSPDYKDIDYWTNLAKLLERGKIHAVFIADVLGSYDVYNGSIDPAIRSAAQFPVHDPFYGVMAMATVTKHLTFGVTSSTTYEQPFHLARRFSTLDHLTKGRIGWNVVTSYLDSAARNLGLGENQIPHDKRYEMADEYMTVVYKLWEQSWEEDAVIRDAKNDVFTNPKKIHRINHKGEYFTVPGPHLAEPSPQRTPVIYQAGTSGPGKRFAAKHAEAIFVSGNNPEELAPHVAEVRKLAAELGRDPASVKVITLLGTVIGDTEEEAKAKYDDYKQYASEEGALALFGGWTGVDLSKYPLDEELKLTAAGSNAIQSALERWSQAAPGVEKWTPRTVGKHIAIGGLGPTIVGTAEQVADEMQRWVDIADVDGFNLSYVANPGTFEDIVDKLVPVLQDRGVFQRDYVGTTMRESINGHPGDGRLNKDHPAHKIIADRIPNPAPQTNGKAK
ncbi:hypothetical protein PYCC9005_001232 [Savitreella phatthalungensis]